MVPALSLLYGKICISTGGIIIPTEGVLCFHLQPLLGKVTTDHVYCGWWDSNWSLLSSVSSLRADGDFLTFDSSKGLWGSLVVDEEMRMSTQRPDPVLRPRGGWSGTAQEQILQLLLHRWSTSVPPTAAGAGDNGGCYWHGPTFHAEPQGMQGTQTVIVVTFASFTSPGASLL